MGVDARGGTQVGGDRFRQIPEESCSLPAAERSDGETLKGNGSLPLSFDTSSFGIHCHVA